MPRNPEVPWREGDCVRASSLFAARASQPASHLAVWSRLTSAWRICSRSIRRVVFFPRGQLVEIRLVTFGTILLLGDVELPLRAVQNPGISRADLRYFSAIKTLPRLPFVRLFRAHGAISMTSRPVGE